MRILIDLQACQSESRRRGIGRYALSLADGIAQSDGGCQPSLLLNAAFPGAVSRIRHRFQNSIPRERIHVFDAPGPVAEMDRANAWRTRAAEALREGYVSTLRPQVLLLSSLFEGFVDDATTSVTSRADRLNAVILYDLIPLVRPTTLPTSEALAWYERKLASLRRADLLLAISEHARSEAIEALGVRDKQVAVIGTAADPTFRPLALDDPNVPALRSRWDISRPYVLYAGGFDERKNVHNLIAAFASLTPELRDRYEIVLAGHLDDRARRALRRVAEDHRLPRERVRFPGRVADADLAALYAMCEVFVFPSLHEGFGLPVLEAMSCGAAVIASSTTSIPEVVGRQDALFDPNDVGAITRKLEQVLRDEKFRIDLRRYGVERAKHYSWTDVSRRTLDALAEGWSRKIPSLALSPATVSVRTTPRLAYVSPLPPERTGIAAYSAELLVALREHYRIDVVSDQKSLDLPAAVAELPLRSLDWFDAHAGDYDRIIYQMGNSPFHHRMFDVLDRNPGTMVLHDIHVGGVLNWMEQCGIAPGIFSRWLFQSHGFPALIDDRARGRDTTIDAYPCSLPLIERASGVIVHSAHAVDLAASWFCVDPGEWRQIPQLRRLPGLDGREAARKALGFTPDDVVFCSFGFIDATKLDDRVVDAWLASPLAADPRCLLLFVGENHGGDYGRNLLRRVESSRARIRITGYVDTPTFDDYLLASDVAIQLRGVTRGETSRTVLDTLAYGLTLICNATGSLREVPADVAVRIPADFSDADLSGALTRVAWDPVLRTQLASNARRYIGDKHDPATIAGHFRDAIEHFAESGRTADYRALMREVAGITTTSDASREDWHATAESIAATVLRPAMRQILVDISVLVTQDLRTGIERVVRSLLQALLERSPAGWRVEPVMARGGRYWYARRFTCEWLGVAPAADDAPIDVASGDVFIGLDWAAHLVPDQEPALLHYRALGVMITFVVYDLLPVLRPDFYPPEIHTMHDAWLHTLARVADGILCISNAVAGELSTWLVSHSRSEAELPGIAVLPLGADIEHSVPSRGLPPDAEQLLEKIVGRPVVLMVGTVEPRKGYAQALAGFESLWRDGIELNLVIVGKQGWMVDEIAFKLRNHPQRGDRLYWFEGATDEWLDAIYRKADVLLAASLGEGYGLPLIEAARYGIPLIARDLPVFREVAGARAMYFSGAEGRDIAGALVDWQRARDIGNVPDSTLIERRSWRECAEAMLSIVLQGRFERPTAKPDAPHQFSAELTVRQVDLARAWLPSSVHSIKGLSAREPWGRWSDADVHPHVEIRFRQPLPVRGTVEIVGRAFGPNVEQAVPVHVGEQAFDVRFQAADTVATFSYALQEGPRSIEIIPPHPMSPRELGTSQDPRRIGIGLIRVTVRATEDVKASSEWTGSRIARLMEAEIKQRSYAPRAKDVHDQTLVTPAASPIAREAPSARKTAGIASVFEWANTLTRLRELGQRVGSLEQRFAEEQDRNERSRRRGEDALREALESVRGEIARSLDSIRGTARERLDHYALLSDQNEQLLQAVERLERDIAAIGARVQEAKSSLEKMLPPTLDDTLEVTGAPIVEPARRKCAIPASVSTPMLSADERYALFEAAFYDSAIVAAKQRVYLPYLDRELARRWPFLDLGCGRGEFLRILRDQAIASVGVDANQTALAALRIAGFDVVLADLVDFLQRDGRTYSGASALQVAEHLLPERLEQMLSLVAPRLAAGAPLIVETPNPLCPFALARFHTDPTHVVPLPPERLRFAIEAAGFERSRTLFQARVPGDPYAGPDACAYYMDYAIIAYRCAS